MNYNEILTQLKAKNLADTFPAIRQKAAEIGQWELMEEVENLWTTYQQMLQFMLQGVSDPQGSQMRQRICRQLAFALSRLERQERLKNNANEKYVSTRKSLKNIPSFSTLVDQLEQVATEMAQAESDDSMRDSIRTHKLEELEPQHEATLQNLFYWTWTSDLWQNSDQTQAHRMLLSDHIPAFDKAVFISAVTLSLLEFTDASKLLFLLDCYLVDDPQVAQRALVGFLLVLFLQFDRLKGNRELKERLFAYAEDPAFVHDAYSAMMQLQMSCTTDSVSTKMRNDIMPALMQSARRKQEEQKDLNLDELTKNGENPEWIKASDDDHLDAKIREMAEMQLDGADVYYSSFSLLKGYPFFGQMPHWFYPFSMRYVQAPALQGILDGQLGKVVRLILHSSPFCNSDKYSLGFMFQGLAGLGEAAVQAQIARQMPPGTDLDDLAESAKEHKVSKADIRRHYIFDLYRFYHSYPYKQQFPNPFATLKDTPITPFGNSWMRQLFGQHSDELAQYADFLMRKEFYPAALHIFTTLATNEFDPSLASIWQKTGFCHQKMGDTQAALHAYVVANNIKPNSRWTLSHLASLSHATGQMEQAAAYYQELLEQNPDNPKYLTNTALALTLCDRFEQAEPLLHKALYIDPQDTRTAILLAWCLMVNQQSSKAQKHLTDVLTAEPNNTDVHLLSALALLIDGKPREAYDRLHGTLAESQTAQLQQYLGTLVAHQLVDKTTATLFTDALFLKTLN